MGISQKAVYITSLFAIKERIIHRDMTVPGGHVPEKMTEAGAAGFRHTIVFDFVNFDKNQNFFLCAVHKFLVSLPLAFSKQKTKMMAQKLGAANSSACPNPQL